MDDRPNIVLSPHFDDAVFSLGGFIAAAPKRAIVVTVFAGIPAADVAGRWDRRSGFKTAAEAMRARALENEAALGVLAVPPSGIVNLDFLDRQYRDAEAPVVHMQSAIGETLRQIVQRHGGPVNIFSPASAWHPDHRLVTDTVLELAKAPELGDVNVFLYQDQPYAYLELRQRTFAPLRFAAFRAVRNPRDVPAEAYWLEFDEAAAIKKQRAANQYKSQFPFVRPLLLKMISDFSRYQAREAGLSSRYAELTYRLGKPRAPSYS